MVIFDDTVRVASKQVMRQQYGKLFADSPDLRVTIASRIAVGEFAVYEEH